MFSVPVYAADAEEQVTITYYGIVVDAPTDFQVYRITDTAVGINWTLPAEADWIHIVGKYGSEPASRTDGHTVYQGAGNSTVDVSVDLEDQINTLYYRAYSRRASDSIWGDLYAEGNIGGTGVLALTELLLILALMGITLWRAPKLGIEGAFLYIMTGGITIAYGLSWADPDDVTLLVEGIVVMFVGIFFLFLAVLKVLGGRRSKDAS